MKTIVSLLTLLLLCVGLLAQAQTDSLETKEGPLLITPIQHASLVLQWNDRVIYVDPFGGAGKYAGMPLPDLVLITDIHGDHLHETTLKELDLATANLIAPQAVLDQLDKEISFGTKAALGNGQSMQFRDIKIEAVPMYNLPEAKDSRHVKGRGNGYVLTLGEEKVYISGDTEDIPEMRALQGIDVAFVCMNLPYTMTVEQAADAVAEFKPKIVFPYHYRGKDGLSNVEGFKKMIAKKAPATEVRLRDWYPEKENQ